MTIVTKHISLDKDCIKKMEPYVEKHQGNFSSAIREIIDNAEKSGIPSNASAIDSSLFNWMLKETDGMLIPDDILRDLINPLLINRIDKLEEYVNYRFKELKWNIEISMKCDNIPSLPNTPSNILVEITGTPQKIKFVAGMISQFLVKNRHNGTFFEIRYMSHIDGNIKVELIRSDNKKNAIDSLIKYFGERDDIIRAIKDRPAFWKSIVNRHILSNYNMITVHRNCYEDLLTGRCPMGEIMIENLAKRPIQDIPLKEILLLIKDVYETSRIVDKIEIHNDTIILYHNYRNECMIEKLKNSLTVLLDTNGHLYDAKLMSNMIVLTHRPDIGIKINEIVDNLKTSDNKLDQELVIFMIFIKGLKDIPDITIPITSLGRRIGIAFMKEYEKENVVKEWNLETFKKAFETIDAKIYRESEWKLEKNNLLYRIRKCNIVTDGDTFDANICRTVREAFRGALEYAFGNSAELDIKKLTSHGDTYCEVNIKL